MSAALLRRFGVSDGDLIGRGGQSSVYALDADRVLRVYNAENDPAFPPALAEAHKFMIADLGADWRRIFVCYRAYLSLLHSGARKQVPALYRWCVRNLNELAES